jgi:glycine oxidase
LFDACEGSLRAYPAFVATVQEASGVDPRLHLDGILQVATASEEMLEVRHRAIALQSRGVGAQILDRSAVLSLEPSLSSAVCGGLLVAAEGSVDNRRLGRALIAACRNLSVDLDCAAPLSVRCDARRALGVVTAAGFAPAGAVVNAAGAWAAGVAGIPADCLPRVRPVKGQMLAIEIPHGFVRRPLWTSCAYLVPRDDGRLLVGATVEERGFDARVTAGGLAQLLTAALHAAPSLSDFSVSEHWAGLRPATEDGLPYVGRTALDGLFTAAGHYRNGILLAPLTAAAIADAIDGGDAGLPAFSPLRHGATASAGMESPAAGANS